MDSKLKSALAVVVLLGIAVCMGQIPVAIVGGNPSANTWTFVNSARASCGSATSCSITYSPAASHLLVVSVEFSNGASHPITGVTGGGASWQFCCAIGPTSQNGISYAYILSSSSGASTIVPAWSVADSTWAAVAEYSFSGSSATFDTNGSLLNQTATTSAVGVGLTLTGTSDVIFQAISNGGGCANQSSISGAFSNPFLGNPPTGISGVGWAGAINQSSGSAPTWTQSGSCTYSADAVAFK